jgi:hypothetical protein
MFFRGRDIHSKSSPVLYQGAASGAQEMHFVPQKWLSSKCCEGLLSHSYFPLSKILPTNPITINTHMIIVMGHEN